MKTVHTFKNRTEVWTKSNDKITSKVIAYRTKTKKTGFQLFDNQERMVYQEIIYNDSTIERTHYSYQKTIVNKLKEIIIFKDKKGVITITNITYDLIGSFESKTKKKYIPNRIFKQS